MTPPTELMRLPSGAVIRVCVECGKEPPRHQYFCPAVASYSRSALLREMVRTEDRVRRYEALIASAVGGRVETDILTANGCPDVGTTVVRVPVVRLERQARNLRGEFWAWAWWLGLDRWDSTEDARADLLAEVNEMRERIQRKRLEDVAA